MIKKVKLLSFAVLAPIFLVIIITSIIVVRINPNKPVTNEPKTETMSINNFSTDTTFSNQWYSSIYKSFPTQEMFAFPLAYKLSEEGIGISLPTINKTPETIYGSYIEDFSIGLENKLSKPTIKKIGNWSIGLQMKEKEDKQMNFTLTHGLPSTTIKTTDQKIIVRLKDAATIYNNGTEKIEGNNTTVTSDAIRVEIHGHSYIIALPKKSSIEFADKKISINSNHVFVGILDSPKNFDLFKANSQSKITDTVVQWNVKGDTLQTTYKFIGQDAPFIAIFPHQSKFIKNKKEILGTYNTLRGKMELLKTDSFITEQPLIVPDTSFNPLQKTYPDFITALKEDQKKILTDNQPDNGDYFLGAWYGKAANLLLLLDAAGLDKERQQLQTMLEAKLLKSVNYLRYNKEKKSVIADKPEFGNENLNDHHFHYGYFIRTAAVLSQFNPAYKDKIDNHITLLISDIANTDRTAKQFPFIRNFDVYEGHSWADGFANFGDGNNQESSSESIGAWYSIYLWAKATGDNQLEQTALYLYNTEIQSTLSYWFGENDMYTLPYKHAIASIVWGGKLDFATWFSAKTNMKYGIQLLPITPGSFAYLDKLKDFARYENDFYNNGGDIKDEWGDLFVMFTSFYNPDKALSLKNDVKKPEANNSKSLFLYTLYHNLEVKE